VQKTLSPSVKDDERFVLFCNKSVSKLNGAVWYGLPNAIMTDLWQPVDAGYAQILRHSFVKLSENGWMMTLTQESGLATTVLSHQRTDAFSSHIG